MAIPLIKGLAVGATLFGGLLAGMAANKVLVELPAWREVGVVPWTNFVRAEDHGLGLILFPAVGGCALLLTIAAAVVFRFDRTAPCSAAVPVYTAAVMAIAAFIVTVGLLAPSRLSVTQAGNDVAALQQIFASVVRWWEVKAALHVLAFGSNLWALVTVLSVGRGR